MQKFSQQLIEMSLELPSTAQQRALAFLQLLQKWNQAYNLTAITDFNQMIIHHLLDSFAVVPFVKGERILDVGTGAGFPGIPLALYFPEKHFTLLDSNGKKTRFIQQAITELKINNVTVVYARVEDYRVETGFDAIIFRAVKSIPEMIKKTAHLCADSGKFLAMKAQYPEEELKGIQHQYSVQRLEIPGMEAERHLVIVEGAGNV